MRLMQRVVDVNLAAACGDRRRGETHREKQVDLAAQRSAGGGGRRAAVMDEARFDVVLGLKGVAGALPRPRTSSNLHSAGFQARPHRWELVEHHGGHRRM